MSTIAPDPAHAVGICGDRRPALAECGESLLVSDGILLSSRLSPAHRALFCLLGPADLRTSTRGALEALRQEDWAQLAHLALSRHRIGPIVWNALKDQPLDELDGAANISQQFAAISLRTLRDTLFAQSETVRIASALNSVGIVPICLKGWPLELQLTGTVGRRTFRDLDLMVEQNDMMSAIRSLVDLGYDSRELGDLTSQRRLSFWLNLVKHVELTDRNTGFVVELHARPFANPRLLPRSEFTLQKFSLNNGVFAEHQLSIPDPISNLLYLSVHGFLHRWERLKWLIDLPPLVASLSEADWQLVRERAARLRLSRPIGTGLMLANTLLGMKIPQPAQPLVRGMAIGLFCNICIREMLAERDPRRTWRSFSSIAGQLAAEHAVSSDTKTFIASFKPKLVSKKALKSSSGMSDDLLYTLYFTRPLSLPSGLWRMFKRG